MSLRYRSIKVAASLLVIFAFVMGAFADTLRLKDGSIIKGKIVSFQDGKFVVAIGEGARKREMTFFANEIQSILFDSPVAPAQVNNNAGYRVPDTQQTTRTSTANTSGPISKPVIRPSNTSTPPTQSGGPMKPIEWNVNVLANNTSNGWTNTGWVVKKGQHIKITGSGTVSLGNGRTAEAFGSTTYDDPNKLLKSAATGALIAVIGDDNDDFIYIGAEREIVATRDGALFLGINEGNLDDNSGSFNVKVEVIPDA
jgi:hypothetical protein